MSWSTLPLALLILYPSLCVVTAQSTPPDTCYVTLDITVPQFCYASLQNRFPQRLNFTVVNGSTLELDPLPENRQVELKVDDSSGGLRGWANLANGLVDGVRSGSLPYGM